MQIQCIDKQDFIPSAIDNAVLPVPGLPINMIFLLLSKNHGKGNFIFFTIKDKTKEVFVKLFVLEKPRDKRN